LKLFLFFFCIFLTAHSTVYGAESFSFSDIQWTDSRDVISEKLKITNDFVGLRQRGRNDQKAGTLTANNDIPYYLVQSNKTLRDINSKLEECGEESIVRVYADENTERHFSNASDTIITSGGRFFFSAFDEKLLYYTITIDPSKTDTVLQTLQEKYGQGTVVTEGDNGNNKDISMHMQKVENKIVRQGKNPDWLMWETENELLYIFVGNGFEPVVYVNKSHIKEVVGHCMEKKKVYTEKLKTQSNKSF